MSDINPYEAPAEWDGTSLNAGAVLVDETEHQIGVWRRGRILVMHRQARLPDRCVKTNQPTTDSERWQHTFIWCHWAVFLSILLGIFIALILYLVLRQKTTIRIGLSKARLAQRRWAITVGCLLLVLSFAGFCVALVAAGNPAGDCPWAGWLALGSLVILLFGTTWMVIGSRVLTAKYIDKHYVWLRGVHPNYLDMLPEWPGE